MPSGYQRNFVKECYDALNGVKSTSLQQAQKLNEVSDIRCVGFTVETKPDYCKERHIDLMLELGITRVEIGVQTLVIPFTKIVTEVITSMMSINHSKLRKIRDTKL